MPTGMVLCYAERSVIASLPTNDGVNRVVRDAYDDLID
jgi:hypothetical protein